jgi:hypothetical protein
MRIQQSSHQGSVVLILIGRLDLAAAPQVQRTILKQLADQPSAIICGLGQVEAAVAALLVRQGVAGRLAMYPSLDQALKYARDRPPRLRERLALGSGSHCGRRQQGVRGARISSGTDEERGPCADHDQSGGYLSEVGIWERS